MAVAGLYTKVMLALLGVVAILPVAIQVESRGETILALTQRIAREHAVQIAVDPVLAKEIVVARLRGVTLDQALASLAKAVGGRATGGSESWSIERDPDAERESNERAVAARRVMLDRLLTRIRRQLDEHPEFDDLRARIYAAQAEEVLRRIEDPQHGLPDLMSSHIERGPSGRLIGRLLLDIGADRLAQIQPGTRAVFTKRPNRFQLPLGERASEHLALFKIEERRLRQYAEVGFGIAGREPEEGDNDILLRLQYGTLGGTLAATYMTVNGPYVGTVFSMEFMTETLRDLFADTPVESDRTTPLRLGPEASRLREALRASFTGGGNPDLPDDLSRQWRDVVAYDPIRLALADGLFAMAERDGLQLAACPPDSVVIFAMVMFGMSEQELLVEGFERLLAQNGCVIRREGDLLLVSPEDLRQTRELRADRTGLTRFLAVAEQPGFGVRQVVQYLATTPRWHEGSLGPLWLMLLDSGETVSSLTQIQSPELARFVGMLSDAQWSALEGQGVLTGPFPPPVQAEFEYYLLHQAESSVYVFADDTVAMQAFEPTLILADPPGPAILRLLAEPPFEAIRFLTGGPFRDWIELAVAPYYREQGHFANPESRFDYGIGQRYRLTVDFGENEFAHTELRFYTAQGRNVGYSELPASIRRQIEDGGPPR